MLYYVYVIELDKAFVSTARAKNANPNANPDKPCVYVGMSSKTPEERFDEHISGKRNSKGPLFSRIVFRYGIRLCPRLYEKHNPLSTKEEAIEWEQELARRYRNRGYTVWSN